MHRTSDQDDRVLPAAEPCCGRATDRRSASTRSRADRGHQQLPRQLLAVASARSSRASWAGTARSTRSRSGSTTPTSQPSELVDDNSTFIIGFGTRLRIRPTVYIVAEAAPRFGLRPGRRARQLRDREARRRPQFPAELLERLRDDAGAGRPRRDQQRQLVFRLQHLAQVLLSDASAQPRRGSTCPCTSRRSARQPRRPRSSRAAADPARRPDRRRSSRRRPARRGRAARPSPSPPRASARRRSRSPSGQSVTFVNNDTRSHEMASDPHPTHGTCPGSRSASARWPPARPS